MCHLFPGLPCHSCWIGIKHQCPPPNFFFRMSAHSSHLPVNCNFQLFLQQAAVYVDKRHNATTHIHTHIYIICQDITVGLYRKSGHILLTSGYRGKSCTRSVTGTVYYRHRVTRLPHRAVHHSLYLSISQSVWCLLSASHTLQQTNILLKFYFWGWLSLTFVLPTRSVVYCLQQQQQRWWQCKGRLGCSKLKLCRCHYGDDVYTMFTQQPSKLCVQGFAVVSSRTGAGLETAPPLQRPAA